MQYHVKVNAAPGGDGSLQRPFSKINEAAKIAMPGDEVLVYPGIYRESVDPKNGGTENARIVYRSVEKNQAVITGAELLSGWTQVQGTVYTARVPNDLFPDHNPYTTLVAGDWYLPGSAAHLGDLFLNGKSMYEVPDLDAVFASRKSNVSWDRDFSVYTWCVTQEDQETVFYANFHGFEPNRETVEITVRHNCFYPSVIGIGYITLSGFCICKAATQWAPPTAHQEGMVGPHWSKGWIIEDCEIAESKCCGISLGKYLQPNNENKWLHQKTKDGTQTERDAVCQALYEGWTKEQIGSHTVRRCNIHDCGQAGIVGHLGCAFSVIEDNHIHHINNKQNLTGAEIGGIKLHGAIDTVIRHNHIHHCTRGLWLDWQAQGTRVTKNLFHDNCLPYDYLMNIQALGTIGEDIFVEVSHGPTLIDHNILLSVRSLKLPTQGVAVVHNLLCGSLSTVGRGVTNGSKFLSSPRYTPYHVPHSTQLAGFMTILHGDMRFYNNIFVQQSVHPLLTLMHIGAKLIRNEWEDMNIQAGLRPYDPYPTEDQWKQQFDGYCGMGSPPSDRYYSHLPVWTGGNVYCNGAKPQKDESDALVLSQWVSLRLILNGSTWTLETDLFEKLPVTLVPMITTQTLGMAFEPEQPFENADGSPIVFDTDYFENRRQSFVIPGPFAVFPLSRTVPLTE